MGVGYYLWYPRLHQLFISVLRVASCIVIQWNNIWHYYPVIELRSLPLYIFGCGYIWSVFSKKVHKRYTVLFTCMSCRAVHIEVAFSLTSDPFINAYRRFVSIRGKVNDIRSDCGTNFIGADREIRHELDGIDNNKVRAHLMKDVCEFKFNVPSASHAGDVWERQIRSVRIVMSALLSTVGSQLDDECLHTFLCRHLSVDNLADPENCMPLSPSNLLTMKPSIVMSLPGNFTRDYIYSRKRWRRVQYLSNKFWLKWRSEYLYNIQLRKKVE